MDELPFVLDLNSPTPCLEKLDFRVLKSENKRVIPKMVNDIIHKIVQNKIKKNLRKLVKNTSEGVITTTLKELVGTSISEIVDTITEAVDKSNSSNDQFSLDKASVKANYGTRYSVKEYKNVTMGASQTRGNCNNYWGYICSCSNGTTGIVTKSACYYCTNSAKNLCNINQ